MALKVLTSEQRHIYMRRIMKSTVNEGSGTTGRTELTFIDFFSTSWLESYTPPRSDARWENVKMNFSS